jgi:hypothetical protein
MNCETRSEQLFQLICKRHGYSISKIPTRSKEALRTADFSVTTPHGRFIAEIEELSPNGDDLRQIKEMKETGRTLGGDTIGARARRAIRHGADQLRFHRAEKLPMLIVLYDNVRTEDGRVGYPMLYVEQPHIDAAMYGDLVVHVPLTPGAPCSPQRSGGKRTTTCNEKNYVSAVAVISDWDDQTLFIYQNFYAEIPFPRAIFSDSKCYHYRKGLAPHSEPWSWHTIEAMRGHSWFWRYTRSAKFGNLRIAS